MSTDSNRRPGGTWAILFPLFLCLDLATCQNDTFKFTSTPTNLPDVRLGTLLPGDSDVGHFVDLCRLLRRGAVPHGHRLQGRHLDAGGRIA